MSTEIMNEPATLQRAFSRYVVRYGCMKQVAEFTWKPGEILPRGSQVIIRSDQGSEWGEVLCEATDRTRDYLGVADGEAGRVLRAVTPDDYQKREQILAQEQKDFLDCQRVIQEHHLAMNVVDIERVFGGERIIIYYLADKRIDFRELVKSLAKEFHTRIQMRQIGVRDEAKLLADYGDCGKPVCCNTHLKEMPPVSMKMAKLQKATLDPNKISGRCGRLKCCLRYEYDTYEDHLKELPPPGSVIMTREGQVKVLNLEILAKKLLVEDAQNRRIVINHDEVVSVITRGTHFFEGIEERTE
jgi:cell fate regulator YaaT (PSP1 superfamily)